MWGGVQRFIDLRALEVASEVRGLHNKHEDECRDRYLEQDRKQDAIRSEQRENMNRIENSMREIAQAREASSRRILLILLSTAGTTIMLLFSIVGYLLTHHEVLLK